MLPYVIAGLSAAVFCFAMYLAFLVFVIIKTKGTAGLRDVAVAIRAFRWPAFWPAKVETEKPDLLAGNAQVGPRQVAPAEPPAA